MADNPFEDPDVQKAANSDGGGMPPPSSDVYGGAYDDDDNRSAATSIDMQRLSQAAKYIPPEQQKEIAVTAGTAMANQAADQVKQDYNDSARTQTDQHERPPPPSYCINLFNWFPLRLFAFFGGLALIAGPILDLILSGTPAIVQFCIYLYLIVFGIVTMFIEAPTWKFTRWFQLKFFFWVRLLSRMWGRAWFYVFTSLLCYAGIETDAGVIFTAVAGVYLTIIGVLSFIFSRLAGKKFVRMREYIAAGTEGDELQGKFIRKFDELDMDGDGRIGSAEIIKAAEQANRTLSNSERHAIQTFLDESSNGYVSKEDWMKQWLTQYEEKGFKQKFL